MRIISIELKHRFPVASFADAAKFFRAHDPEVCIDYDETAIDRAHDALREMHMQNLDKNACALMMGPTAFWSVRAWLLCNHERWYPTNGDHPGVRVARGDQDPDRVVLTVCRATAPARLEDVPIYLAARLFPENAVFLLTGADGQLFPRPAA